MLSLYIHIPFCVRKCHYCGFYSTIYSPQAADEFISAVLQEAEQFRGRTVHSIYIGGGTPSVLSLDQWERLFAAVNKFTIESGAEFTVEANPNSLTRERLSFFRERGVNRLSLGVQSFSEKLLRLLGRSHTVQQAVDAFLAARDAGFQNIGIDLIYGIPGQTEDEWQKTLIKTVDLRPDHISTYSLSVDEGSRFSKEVKAGRSRLPDDELVALQYQAAISELSKSGYDHYEISNFSIPGFACLHNMNYWQRGEYLGLGPAAWSFMNNRRWGNVADLREYCARVKTGRSLIEEEESPDPVLAASERIMLALRTSRGLDLEQYEQEFGTSRVRELSEKSLPLERSGLLVSAGGRMRLTQNGFLVANEVLERLIP